MLIFPCCRFAHLINIDFFDDLFNVINELVRSEVRSDTFAMTSPRSAVAFSLETLNLSPDVVCVVVCCVRS